MAINNLSDNALDIINGGCGGGGGGGGYNAPTTVSYSCAVAPERPTYAAPTPPAPKHDWSPAPVAQGWKQGPGWNR